MGVLVPRACLSRKAGPSMARAERSVATGSLSHRGTSRQRHTARDSAILASRNFPGIHAGSLAHASGFPRELTGRPDTHGLGAKRDCGRVLTRPLLTLRAEFGDSWFDSNPAPS